MSAGEAMVYLNGRLVPAAQARVSVLDRGFLFGDGVFETVRAYGGRFFRPEAHYARLVRSAAYAAIPLPFDGAGFLRILAETLGTRADALVRVTVTRGEGPPVPDPAEAGAPTVMAIARPVPAVAGRTKRGIALVTGPHVAVPGAAKTTSYLGPVLALADARRRGADEAVRLNAAGEVAEGSISNLFGVWAGRLATPPEAAGVLPGVTRGVVLELARKEGMDVAERAISPAELTGAQELFVTGTGWEVMPATRLDGRPMGDGRPGPVTARLVEAFRRLVAEECA